MGRPKKNHYTFQQIDTALEKLIKEFQNNEKDSFREASRQFAEFHKRMKWEMDAKNRLFSFFIPAATVWALGYLIIISVF